MQLRIAIVGSGAIGSYYGGKLAAAGCDVHFLVRGDLAPVQRDGLHIYGPGEDIRLEPIKAYSSTKEIGPCDLVIIAVKATSSRDVVDVVPPLLHEATMLLTLQNGLGNEEFLAEHFGPERVLGGLCFIALKRVSRTEVERFAHGDMVLGEHARRAQPRTHEVAAAFRRTGMNCEVTHNLAQERWRKLIWNIPFNGLSILAGGIDTAAIIGDEQLRKVALALMVEVIAAANECGHALRTDSWRELMERSKTMGAFKPSTLLDWEAGKPLEIEAIWGEPLRRARGAGCNMPRTEMMYALLNQVDQQRSRTNLTALSRQL
jgi:2-dehydropantoate 2-reductase